MGGGPVKRSTKVTIGAVVVVAACCVAGLVNTEAAYDQVCAHRESMIRLDDGDCDGSDANAAWYYIQYPRFGSLGPHPVGSRVKSGTFSQPTSGAFHRGGFGGSRGAFSGGG